MDDDDNNYADSDTESRTIFLWTFKNPFLLNFKNFGFIHVRFVYNKTLFTLNNHVISKKK